MIFLALDTATAACSVAVHDDAHALPLAKAFVAMERGHAEALAPMVQAVMAKAGLAFADLQRIVVTTGPGTFTGVRIGLAMARGLGSALGIPVTGIDTLTAIAANHRQSDMPLLVAADARRGEVYAALFAPGGKPLRASAVMSISACAQLLPAGPVMLLGTAADAVIAAAGRDDLGHARSGDIPDAANFRFGFDLAASGEMPAPLYLRSPDAKPQEQAARWPLAPSFAPASAAMLAAIHAECFDNPWHAEAFAALLDQPGVAAELALDGGEPVGFILTRRAAGEAEIITIGTRPFAQRRGVARALLDRQLTELRAAGAAACFIEVAVSNAAARALYASRGFREAGTRRGYYERGQGNREDAIVMRRDSAP